MQNQTPNLLPFAAALMLFAFLALAIGMTLGRATATTTDAINILGDRLCSTSIEILADNSWTCR